MFLLYKQGSTYFQRLNMIFFRYFFLISWFAEVNSRTFSELRVKKPHPGSRGVKEVGFSRGHRPGRPPGATRFKRGPDRSGIDQIRADEIFANKWTKKKTDILPKTGPGTNLEGQRKDFKFRKGNNSDHDHRKEGDGGVRVGRGVTRRSEHQRGQVCDQTARGELVDEGDEVPEWQRTRFDLHSRGACWAGC